MFNISRRTAKKFTESETNAARASGRFDSVDGVENQSRRGIYSGISRRQIALEKALAGSASRKTLKTSTMNLITTGSIMQEYQENHGLMFAFAKLCKTMTPFEALVQVSERVQRLEASKSRFHINTWNAACHWSYRSPVAVFEHVCKHASELAEKLLEKFLRFFSMSANLSNPAVAAKEQPICLETMETKTSADCSSVRDSSKQPSLPVELYRLIRARASKMLPSFEFKQITAKLRDCFMRQDHQRFEYILSEASKGRSIFANTGKFATSRKKRTIILDKDAGKLGFLATYGMAYDAQCGLIHA